MTNQQNDGEAPVTHEEALSAAVARLEERERVLRDFSEHMKGYLLLNDGDDRETALGAARACLRQYEAIALSAAPQASTEQALPTYQDWLQQGEEADRLAGRAIAAADPTPAEPTFSIVNEALPGELPSSRYSAETIAYANACNLLRVTSDGLGFIRGVKPDYPEPALTPEPQGILPPVSPDDEAIVDAMMPRREARRMFVTRAELVAALRELDRSDGVWRAGFLADRLEKAGSRG